MIIDDESVSMATMTTKMVVLVLPLPPVGIEDEVDAAADAAAASAGVDRHDNVVGKDSEEIDNCDDVSPYELTLCPCNRSLPSTLQRRRPWSSAVMASNAKAEAKESNSILEQKSERDEKRRMWRAEK